MNDKLYDKYALLAEMIETGKVYLDPSVDFGHLCRSLGVRAAAMDALFRRELGMGGDEVLSAYRRMALEEVSMLH